MMMMTDTKPDHGLTADEERHLALHCLRDGPYPRTVVIERTGTQYQVPSRQVAKRLLRLLGTETEAK